MKSLKFLALGLALLLPPVSWAQEPESDEGDSRSSVVKVDKWTIKPEVSNLTRSMQQFNGLINNLNKANTDLGDSFKKYLTDPNNELLGSEVEKKLAAYAANVSKDFDAIIASQDVFTANFRNLRHKLGQLEERLQGKSSQYKTQLLEYKTQARNYEKQLIDMAAKIKDPDISEEERQKLKREFSIVYRRFKMEQRYFNGYASRYQGYIKLQDNMGKLSGLFGGLHTRFEDLILNLENEKKFLKASIELQVDTLRIKKLLQEGIIGGEQALVNVSQKLATLYLKVDDFNKVHDRISDQMNRFLDSSTTLMNVTDQINKIGAGGIGTGDLNSDLDKVIDEFAKKDGTTLPGVEDEPLLPEKTEGGATGEK